MPPLPGRTVNALAWDADGRLLLAGPEGTATITNGIRTIDDLPPAAYTDPGFVEFLSNSGTTAAQ